MLDHETGDFGSRGFCGVGGVNDVYEQISLLYSNHFCYIPAVVTGRVKRTSESLFPEFAMQKDE